MPQLEAIHAHARGVAPLALFGDILVLIDASIPPWTECHPSSAEWASLNIFCALVGPSGAGKGSALSLAQQCIDLPNPNLKPVGHRRGLVKAYVAKVDVPIHADDDDIAAAPRKEAPAKRLCSVSMPTRYCCPSPGCHLNAVV